MLMISENWNVVCKKQRYETTFIPYFNLLIKQTYRSLPGTNIVAKF